VIIYYALVRSGPDLPCGTFGKCQGPAPQSDFLKSRFFRPGKPGFPTKIDKNWKKFGHFHVRIGNCKMPRAPALQIRH